MAVVYFPDRILVTIPNGAVKLILTSHVGGLILRVNAPDTGELTYEVPAGTQAIIETVPGMTVSFISIGESASYILTAE
jgi:hypothetical protein